jgi:hypothetical protein
MSIQTAVYLALANDPTLGSLLNTSTINPEKPAIYEVWAPQDTPMPYINLTYTTAEGNHWGKRNATLFVDIFSDSDSIQAEAIRNRVLKILDRQTLELENNHSARVHSDRDTLVTDTTPRITHWEMEFSIYYWRKTWIETLTP